MLTKDVGFQIRIDKALREEFVEVCRAQDRPAAQVVREFMRQYVDSYRQNAQGSLFPDDNQFKVG
jgi:hypothetical protein